MVANRISTVKSLIPKSGLKAIDKAIEALFNRMKVRFLAKKYEPKAIRFAVEGFDKPVQYRPDLNLPNLFEEAARAEGFKPTPRLQESVVSQVEQYLDAHQELAKAKVKNAVQSVLSQAEIAQEDVDVQRVLRNELNEVMGKVHSDVAGVIEGETNKARNISTLDAIVKANTFAGVDDPTVVFIGPNDAHCCADCKRLFFMPDGTPRAWKMSQLKAGYGKHGDQVPSLNGIHPSCRHFCATMLPGYGFKAGKIEFIDFGYDVYEEQNS